MNRTGSVFVLLLSVATLGAQAQPRPEAAPTAQIDAMKRLAWLEGTWEGSASFMTAAGASPAKSWERVALADIARNDKGQWHEVGYSCSDGAPCVEFLRMTLERKGAP